MEKIKILFFHFDLQGGGAEKVLVNLVNNLDPDRYDITVQTIFGSGVHKSAISQNIRLRSLLQCRPFKGMRLILKLFSPRVLHRLLVRERYDIEVAFLELIPTRIVGGCENSDTRLYAWLHNTVGGRNALALASRSVEEMQHTYAAFDKIAFVSEGVRDAFYQNHEGVNTPGEVVHNVLETDRIVQSSKEPLEDLQLATNCLNLCSVGRLCGQKGYDRLITSLATVSNLVDREWHLYLIGAGPEKDALLDIAKSRGIDSKITFLGYKQNPYKYVSKMDLFVCSSYFEGYSTAVTESIIVGTPVLTTDCSGMREIFGETDAGLIVENSEEALVEGLIKVLGSPGLIQHMKSAVVERSNFYSKESCINQFERFIETV